MGVIELYICSIYAVLLIACAVGAFNCAFDANTLQRVSLAAMSIWSAWRIQLIIENGWGYPHEPLLSTAIGLYAIGTIQKTFRYRRK